MNIDSPRGHGFQEEGPDIPEAIPRGFSPPHTLVSTQITGESKPNLEVNMRIRAGQSSPPYQSQSSSSCGSWLARSGLTEGSLLIDGAVSDRPDSRQDVNLNADSAQNTEEVHQMEFDDDADGESLAPRNTDNSILDVEEVSPNRDNDNVITRLDVPNRMTDEVNGTRPQVLLGSSTSAPPAIDSANINILRIPILRLQRGIQPEGWVNSALGLRVRIGFTEVAHSVEIGCNNREEQDSLLDDGYPPIDIVRDRSMTDDNASTHSREGSDRYLREPLSQGYGEHNYARLASLSPLHPRSNSQYSHSTNSDACWANEMQIEQDHLLIDSEDDVPDTLRVETENLHSNIISSQSHRTDEQHSMPTNVEDNSTPPLEPFAADNLMEESTPEKSVNTSTDIRRGLAEEVLLTPDANRVCTDEPPETEATENNPLQADDRVEAPISTLMEANSSNKPKGKSRALNPNSRCIVRFSDLMKQFQEQFDSELHAPFACSISNLTQIGEVHDGFRTKFIFRCNMCNGKSEVWSELKNDQVLDVNRCCVIGTHAIGKGYAALKEWTANVDIHCPDWRKYQNLSVEIDERYIDISEEEILQNGIEVRRIAQEKNSLINGIPACPVTVDGSWHTRSYGGKSRAESGMAVIISLWTGKVLFKGWRCRYCYICQRIENGTLQPRDHKCWVNWPKNQSVLGMESDIIVEGFLKSREQHGLIYSEVVGDGDSSVYPKVLQADPYEGICMVKKIECRLHLQRGRTKEIRNTAQSFKTGRSQEAKDLKLYMFRSIPRICKDVTSASRHWANQSIPEIDKVIGLKKDVLNVIDHVFGNHVNCATYFCDGKNKPGHPDLVPLLQAYGLYVPLKTTMETWSHNATDLLQGKTSNLAECFNSVLAKFNFHKGVNVQLRGMYAARVAMAAIQFSNQAVASTFHKKSGKKVPMQLVRMERTRRAKNKRNRKYKKVKRFSQLAPDQTESMKKSLDYGKNPEKPDMDPANYALAKEVHWQMLRQWQKDRVEIELLTRNNASQEALKDKKIIMTRHFGRICRMQISTATGPTVASILYPRLQDTASKNYEQNIKDQIRKYFSGSVTCGITIDVRDSYLGAKADAILPDGRLVMIHCPYKIRGNSIADALQNPKFGLQKIIMNSGINADGEPIMKMKETHHLYYEVLGELAITQKEFCEFVLATDIDFITVRVQSNANLWNQMRDQLEKFYESYMLPEIIDSRRKRKMNLRDDKRSIDKGKTKVSRKPKQANVLAPLTSSNDVHQSNGDGEEDVNNNGAGSRSNYGELNQEDNFGDEVEAFLPNDLSELDYQILLFNQDGGELDATHMDVFGQIMIRRTNGLYEYRSPTLQAALSRIRPIDPLRNHVQILNRGRAHWVCAYYDYNAPQIYIYDSKWPTEGIPDAQVYHSYLQRLFPQYSFTENPVIFPYVQQQGNSIDCGVFALAFAVSLMHGVDPAALVYDQTQMRGHLGIIYRTKTLIHFPTSEDSSAVVIPNLDEYVLNEIEALQRRIQERGYA